MLGSFHSKTRYQIISVIVCMNIIFLMYLFYQQSAFQIYGQEVINKSLLNSEAKNKVISEPKILGTTENIAEVLIGTLGLENATSVTLSNLSLNVNSVGYNTSDIVSLFPLRNTTENTILKIDDFSSIDANNILETLNETKVGDVINVTVGKNESEEIRTIIIISKDYFPNFVEILYGNYSNFKTGLEISFPLDWTGIRLRGLMDLTILSPQGIDILTMNNQNISSKILVTDLSFVKNITSNLNKEVIIDNNISTMFTAESSKTCEKSIGLNNISINGSNITEIVNECSSEGLYSNTRSYEFAIPQNIVTISLNTNSPKLNEEYESEFVDALQTMKINGVVNMTQVLIN